CLCLPEKLKSVGDLPACGILKRGGKRPENYPLNGHTRLIDHCSSILRLPLYDDISMTSNFLRRVFSVPPPDGKDWLKRSLRDVRLWRSNGRPGCRSGRFPGRSKSQPQSAWPM